MAKNTPRVAAQRSVVSAAVLTLYVYSTLSSDVNYVNHAAGGADMPVAIPDPENKLHEGVFIKGGAGVANDRLVTPRGVATRISEAQAEYLRANTVFKLHEENGYVQISSDNVDPDKAAADMEGRDASAPIVPQDPDAEGLKTDTSA